MEETWIDRRWAVWSMAAGLFAGADALLITRDWRAGVLGLVASGGLNVWVWRPGGPGHRLRRREREREDAGLPMARPGCVIAMGAVAVLVIASALVGALFVE